jgi:hypothetical protein
MATAVRYLSPILPKEVSPKLHRTTGANVAKYAGQYLWKRIVDDKLYKKGDYAAALKAAFLGCDADMKSRTL